MNKFQIATLQALVSYIFKKECAQFEIVQEHKIELDLIRVKYRNATSDDAVYEIYMDYELPLYAKILDNPEDLVEQTQRLRDTVN